MREDQEFRGIFPYLVSPINSDGSVRSSVVCDLVRNLLESGVHGFTPLGTTGEAPYLTFDQRVNIVRAVVTEAGYSVPVVPAVSATSTYDAIRQAQKFVDIGVDGLVLMLQGAQSLSTSAVENYFAEVAQSVSCPIVLYSNPNVSDSGLSLESIVKLSSLPNVKYVKDASGNTGRILSILNRVGDQLRVFSASAHVPLLVFQLGGVGWMAGPACIVPEQSVRLYELAKAERYDEATQLQRQLWRLNELFQKYSMAACAKAALQIQGFDVGPPIHPQESLQEPVIKEIRWNLSELSVLNSEGDRVG